MGTKIAVLVGCNYPNTQLELNGCINDVLAMKDVLQERFGFDPSHVKVLTDAPNSDVKPTGANIRVALNEMVGMARRGDVLFFHFSGHGTRIPSLEPGQPSRQDEAIVPCDLNLITDTDFRHLLNRVPKGASFTILSDSCHSGDLIDKEKEQIGPVSIVRNIMLSNHRVRGIPVEAINQCMHSFMNIYHGAVDAYHGAAQVVEGLTGLKSDMVSVITGIFKKDVSLKFQTPTERDFNLLKSLGEDEGILLSGCQANETSADVAADNSTGRNAHGAFTDAVLHVLNEENGPLTNRKLVMKARMFLQEHGFEQHPCLYCSDENADAPFLGLPTPLPDA